jgi:hypothetical protein
MTSIIPEALLGSLNLETWKRVRNTLQRPQDMVLVRHCDTPCVWLLIVYTEVR